MSAAVALPLGSIARPRPASRALVPSRSRSRQARAAVAWLLATLLLLNVAAFALLEHARPDLRDREYGRRLVSLRQRVGENPGRPLAVVVGSSRAAMGVCPRAWEETRPGTTADPLLFNVSRVGGGPLMSLMTLRRLYADGVRPAAVVLEYWPPLLRQDGSFRETDRINADKLYRSDVPFVRSYHPHPNEVERLMLANRLNPCWSNRTTALRELAPRWLPRSVRVEGGVDPLDGWGWLPGHDVAGLRFQSRAARLAHCERIYRDQLADLRVDPMADRAIRESVALAREHGAEVVIAYLPESTEFRGWYSHAAEELGRTYLAQLQRELRVPVIDARTWLADESLADGFHATQGGAEEFSRVFGPAVASAVSRSARP